METVAIEAKGVSKQYGEITALDKLTLAIRPGEIFGLVGANGAGKTTLIKVLVGLLSPDAGQVRVLGLDPRAQAPALRAQIGYMPQTPALYQDLTALENLRFFAAARATGREARRLAEAALAQVNLSDRGNDLVSTYSGGMKQRLSLSCALLHHPRLLLLDEPSTGVDLHLRQRLWRYFRDQVDGGGTIVVSTHQMDEVVHCDRVAIIRAGRVLACDTPQGLLARGTATVTLWRDGAPTHHHLHNYAAELPDLLGLAGIQRIELARPTLEEIVLSLIGAQEPDEKTANQRRATVSQGS
jgi:ABC-2 type transport system ATP-binding protein